MKNHTRGLDRHPRVKFIPKFIVGALVQQRVGVLRSKFMLFVSQLEDSWHSSWRQKAIFISVQQIGSNVCAGSMQSVHTLREKAKTNDRRLTSGRAARGRGGNIRERGFARATAARVAAAMDSEEAILRWLEPDESGASRSRHARARFESRATTRASWFVSSPSGKASLTASSHASPPIPVRFRSLHQPRRCSRAP